VVILVFARALQGAVGFGANLVAAPLLVLLDPVFVPGPLIAVALALNALMVWREEEKVHPRHVGLALAGRVPGSALGVLALVALPVAGLNVLFGATVLLAVALSVSGLSLETTSPAIVGAGALSGFMGTATSIGGPPIALLYQHEPGPRFRATVAHLLVYGGLISLAMILVAGQFGVEEAIVSVAILPAVVAGFVLSGRLTRHIDKGRTRTFVLVLSTVAAVAVILKGVL
jgi:hypothetical protein